MKLQFIELTKEMLRPSHLDDINNLLPQLSSSARPCTGAWLDCMFDSGTRLFVALDDNKIVGTVLLCTMVILVGRKDWIEDVVVDKNYRRQGIASRLMDLAERASHERGAHNINLTSNPDRGDARRMYDRRGYDVRKTGIFRLTF